MKRAWYWLLLALGLLWPGGLVGAATTGATVPLRDPTSITDWYIHDLAAEFTVNPDSSVRTRFTIVADAGDLPDKHSIFVTVPTHTYLTGATVMPQPVTLLTITDENGAPYQYSTSRSGPTITWKIGDADRTITGQHTYIVDFTTRNAVRFADGKAEFYWDIWGVEWALPVDNYRATVTLPAGFDQQTAELNLYSGRLGEVMAAPVQEAWLDERTLQVVAERPLDTGEGITVSIITPDADLFTPDPLGIQSKYFTYASPLDWLWLLLPAAAVAVLYQLWRRYGDDPTYNPTVAPEFAPPDDLDPLTMGLLYTNGSLPARAVAAGVIDLAVRGQLTMTEEETKILGMHTGRDYRLAKTAGSNQPLPPALADLYERLFAGRDEVKLSALKNTFYTEVAEVTELMRQRLVTDGRLETTGRTLSFVLLGLFVAATGGLVAAGVSGFSSPLVLAGALLAITFLIFGLIMPRRPEKGLAAYQKIRGFVLYLKTAERYRQRFFEEKGLWERLLPYAILFGLTDRWARLLRDLAAEPASVMHGYVPLWYHGVGLADGSFDAGRFSQSITAVSGAVASSLTSSPSSSGGGGGGFSGGGGGGGGGGGW